MFEPAFLPGSSVGDPNDRERSHGILAGYVNQCLGARPRSCCSTQLYNRAGVEHVMGSAPNELQDPAACPLFGRCGAFRIILSNTGS